MNELIRINHSENGMMVDGRELHEFLEVDSRFNDWIDRRIVKYGFIEDVDFYSTLSKTPGRPSKEYSLTIGMAKELCMVESNEKGSQARRYFIQCEKIAKGFASQQLSPTYLLHFQKEQMQLEFAMNVLRINEGSRIKMLYDFNKAHNLTTEYLPAYTEEKLTESLTILLNKYNIGMTAASFNKLLMEYGYLEEKTRPSTCGKTKTFKALTDSGLHFGKNLINPHNQKETQPHYYEETFLQLVQLVTTLAKTS